MSVKFMLRRRLSRFVDANMLVPASRRGPGGQGNAGVAATWLADSDHGYRFPRRSSHANSSVKGRIRSVATRLAASSPSALIGKSKRNWLVPAARYVRTSSAKPCTSSSLSAPKDDVDT